MDSQQLIEIREKEETTFINLGQVLRVVIYDTSITFYFTTDKTLNFEKSYLEEKEFDRIKSLFSPKATVKAA